MSSESTMREVLEAFPGAQRALFRRYHIGGCSSCAFQPDETLEQLCARNGNLNVSEVLDHIKTSHEQDAKIFIEPAELASWLKSDPSIRLVDVRSREEFDSEVVARLEEHNVGLVILAGFMRILSSVFIDAFPYGILNIHPALLPAVAKR